MMLDIDDFKRINDNYGHIEGDRVIVTLSKALLAEFPNALIGRFGGDEFLLYFVGAKEEDHVEELGKKVVKIMNKIKINGSIPLCGSIGISLSRGGFFSVDREADSSPLTKRSEKPMRRCTPRKSQAKTNSQSNKNRWQIASLFYIFNEK